MALADVERVIYDKNPLIEVVCQLRFPRILSINETAPAQYQEMIRGDFPLYDVAIEQQQQFSLDSLNASLLPIPIMSQSESIKNYRFSSADGKWHINLTSTFLAITTSDYTRWEDFRGKLEKPLNALLEIYKPAFYERIGLRYVDAFRRTALGLNGVDWSELINPMALGFLSYEPTKQDVKSYNSITELDIGNGALAQVKSILGLIGSIENGFPQNDAELSFIVDSDMFFMRKNIDELDSSLDYLHRTSTKLIRSLITEKLHHAMEPKAI